MHKTSDITFATRSTVSHGRSHKQSLKPGLPEPENSGNQAIFPASKPGFVAT